MFTKADSLLGRSVLDFARIVDKQGETFPARSQLAPAHG
jgi:hypothetical protein